MNALVFWLAIFFFYYGVSFASSQPPTPTPQPLIVPPLGLPSPLPVPDSNPLTPEKVALGRRLFFDRRLSPNDTMACAMCHVPAQGFTVNELRLAVGINGQTTKRNPPALYNVAYQRLLFHDGREFTLEDQIISPLTNPVEMGNPSIGYVVDKVRKLPGYEEQFRQAFGEGVSVATLGKALASYERTLLSGNSPFDRWYFGGETHAVTEEVKAGFAVFAGKGKCVACHSVRKDSALFTDQEFHNTGAAHLQLIPEKQVDVDLGGGLIVQMPRAQIDEILTPPSKDLGRYEVTLDPEDLWRYKTPSLRNVALTAPYMHNGALLTLEDVIEYYDRGGTKTERQDARIAPLHLTSEEKDALLAFLHSLTGDNVESLSKEHEKEAQNGSWSIIRQSAKKGEKAGHAPEGREADSRWCDHRRVRIYALFLRPGGVREKKWGKMLSERYGPHPSGVHGKRVMYAGFGSRGYTPG